MQYDPNKKFCDTYSKTIHFHLFPQFNQYTLLSVIAVCLTLLVIIKITI